MNKVFIDVFNCKTASQIFTGKNALIHALYFLDTGRICQNGDDIFGYKSKQLLKICSWHNGVRSIRNVADKDNIEGDGVHMKIYETHNHVIFSSQNNVNSPLFEFAIVFEKRPKLLEFFNRSFERAKAYSKWWKLNKNY